MKILFLQVSVFGTSVLAARAMAAAGWPGFAQGGALWFPDLTKAALVIDWGQVSRTACWLLLPSPLTPARSGYTHAISTVLTAQIDF